MNRYINIFLICFASIGLFSCKSSQKASSDYEKNSVFGTINPTREECEILFSQFIKNIKLKKGDVVADIGASWGYKDFGMSVITDSVSFYIEDIDSKYVNDAELNKVASQYYPNCRTTPQTNAFHLTTGTARKTNLPDNGFDIIMLNNSLHEFTYVDDMLNDIYIKLKPTGKIVIEEYFSTTLKPHILKGCYITAYTQAEIVTLMNSHGFYLTCKMLPENEETNNLVFEKNEQRSKEYLSKKEKLDNYLSNIKFSGSELKNSDSLKIDALSKALVIIQPDLIEVYPTFELWLNDIGYDFYYKNNFKLGISIFMMNVRLFPNSYNVYDSLGDAYYKNNQKELALLNFTKALELYPENKAERDKVEKVKKEISQ